MTSAPLTFTLTEQQRLLVSEALAMLAASRRSQNSTRSHSDRNAYGSIRMGSRAVMEKDGMTELNALRRIFGTTNHEKGESSVDTHISPR
jgi:hypothetical protein